jgi:hypothetical protein
VWKIYDKEEQALFQQQLWPTEEAYIYANSE